MRDQEPHTEQKETNMSNTRESVLVTTSHRGVFCGLAERSEFEATTMTLTEARMAIRWGTTEGLFELAATGPTGKSKISAKVPELILQDVTSVSVLTESARKAWDALA